MLTQKDYVVKDLILCKGSSVGSWENGILSVSEDALRACCLSGIEGIRLDFALAKPGESTRIVHITDTVMPVWKEEGSTFPGWTEGASCCGDGVLHRLQGMTLMQSFSYPGIQEGLLDMSGEGSRYSRFSGMLNLVISVTLTDPSVEKPTLARKLILIVLRAAEFLAGLTAGASPDREEVLDAGADNPEQGNLPRVGYAYYIQAQGPLRNVHIMGEDCTQMKPRFLRFSEITDGALVSGNYIIACQKNPTIYHQANPVIEALRRQDGKSLRAVGAIVSTESGLLEKKQENAALIASMATELGLDGIIITQEGGGHADVDLMLCAEACEKAGIPAVIETNELAGPNGDLPPLVSSSPYADAIVSTGNNDEVIRLPQTKSAIGGDRILNGKYGATAAFDTALGILYTATSQLGANTMRTAAL